MLVLSSLGKFLRIPFMAVSIWKGKDREKKEKKKEVGEKKKTNPFTFLTCTRRENIDASS